MTANIYIVEDHEIMRQALIDYFENLSDFQIVGAVGTAEEALQGIGDVAVNLVLVDTSLPDMNGIELIGRLREQWPDLPCVMLTGHDQHTYVKQAMEAGAQGYVLKGDPDEISEAIERVLDGEVYLTASVEDKQ